ncbi:sortase-dependent protein [Streptomyces sp. PTD5-9]|uniref:sortase-dependent protein n=1 Tax=Streptomyces sp. PTD5-9 TaxID=3120150 RepID=UPI0030086178
MRHRSILRTAVLAAVAAGAVLVPSAAAFADTPTPVASVTSTPAGKGTPEEPVLIRDASKPIGKVVLGDPSPVPRGTTPRGGVAAGEQPVAASDDNTAVLAGSAAAALLVAGAGTLVLRRRTAAQPGR